MSVEEFIENLGGLNDGQDFPPNLLKQLYSSIRGSALEMEL